MLTIDNIYDFYKLQPSQNSKIKEISDWFDKIENITSPSTPIILNKKKIKKANKNNVLLVIGDTGIGKTLIIQEFIKKCTYNVINIGRLFDIYDNSNIYSIKDFIPKLLKQKNVSDISTKKLLLIDSLEEFMVIQKTIIRDIIESIDTLGIPVVLVSERISFDTLEKKVIVKLKKEATIIELEKPNIDTLKTYIKKIDNNISDSPEILDKIVNECNGDMRNLTHLINFCKIKAKNTVETKTNHIKDYIPETEKAIVELSDGKLSNCFNRCESDPFIFGMLTYENYIHSSIKEDSNKKNIINMICFSDYLEKKLFKNQQWELLEHYSFFSTIYPWKQLEPPKTVLSSSTLQKYMNTKKRNRKAVLDF